MNNWYFLMLYKKKQKNPNKVLSMFLYSKVYSK